MGNLNSGINKVTQSMQDLILAECLLDECKIW